MRVALVSGGPDGVAAALVTKATRWLFVDYSQSFLDREQAAITYLTKLLPHIKVYHAMLPDLPREGTTVVGRNEALLRKAIEVYPAAELFVLGTRCIHPLFDKHGDCTPHWARRMEKKYDVAIQTPVTGWIKPWVLRYLDTCGVDPSKLYCSEGIAP